MSEYVPKKDMGWPLRMGWLRLVGSLKLQVSFAQYRLFYRALLQKRPVILRSLLTEATPYLSKEIYKNVRICPKKRYSYEKRPVETKRDLFRRKESPQKGYLSKEI